MKVVEIKRTCEACPSQWEGKLSDGRMIYVRFRWGSLNISVSPKPTDDIMDAVGGEHVFGTDLLGHPLDGYMEYSKLKEIASHIEWPEDDGFVQEPWEM